MVSMKLNGMETFLTVEERRMVHEVKDKVFDLLETS